MRGLWPLLCLLASTDAVAAPVRCDVETKHRCTPDGCAPVAPTTYAIVDGAARTYARCDVRGCDAYPATFAVSGGFLNIALPEHGMMAKVWLGESRFLEVATLGIETFTSFGACAFDP